MKLLAFVAAAAFALPAVAEDATPTEGEIDAPFTWSAIDLATAPASDGGVSSLVEAHLVVTSNVGGPLHKLAGTCLMQGLARGDDWEATGSCALKDADGDFLFESIAEEGGRGRAVLTGGTGKFAGITGALDYTTTWYASIRHGENQGVGHKKGHWKRPAT
jgi:hypothetical protein